MTLQLPPQWTSRSEGRTGFGEGGGREGGRREGDVDCFFACCRFFGGFVSLMGYKYKVVFGAAAEVVGLILAYLEENQHVSRGPALL